MRQLYERYKGYAMSIGLRYIPEVSDVEDECNGLLSYDRKVVKTSIEKMKKINEKIKL